MFALRTPVVGLAICTVIVLGMLVNRPAIAQPSTDVQVALAQEKAYSSGGQPTYEDRAIAVAKAKQRWYSSGGQPTYEDRAIAVAKAKQRWYERYYGTNPVTIGAPDRETTVAQAKEDYFASYGAPTTVAQAGTASSGSDGDDAPWLLIAILAGGVVVLATSTVLVRRQKVRHAMA